jgi:hypothetical protein
MPNNKTKLNNMTKKELIKKKEQYRRTAYFTARVSLSEHCVL